MQVTIDHLALSYGSFAAVRDLSLTVNDGESLVLLGKSGCGKTSTMRCIAGLEEPSGGRITIGDNVVFDADAKLNLPANRRNVGLVFQSYAIWPHMTVFQNIAFPLRMKKLPKAELRERVTEMLGIVGLAHLADNGASMLSGGQMQRVALARSLAMSPAVMMLDEPLSNLDARLRDDLRVELRRLQQELGLTSIYVTHDQGEALALADRIAIMEDGNISQLATPEEIYARPASASIATFLGFGNVFRVGENLSGDTVRLADHDMEVTVGEQTDPAGGRSVTFRPENVRLSDVPPENTVNAWRGTVEVSVFQGAFARCTVELEGGLRLELTTQGSDWHRPVKGDRVWVQVDPKSVRVVPDAVEEAVA